ncbi:MAG: xylose isomerase protein [Subtercola sp.]|nr:xylose isomerase protein [Subtercola sp.]
MNDMRHKVVTVIFSLSTLNWLTFPLPAVTSALAELSEPLVPFSSAPFGVVLDAAAAEGFAAVGLDSVALGSAMLTPAGRSDVADAVSARKLVCTDIGVLRVGQSDGLESAAAFAALASELGSRSARHGVGGDRRVPCCGVIVDAPLTAAVIEQLRICADVLWASRCRMAVEFMAYGPLGRLDDAAELCATIGWDRAGLLLDSWHVVHSGTALSEVAALDASQIALVQVSDGTRRAADAGEFFTASRWGRQPPGAGTFDISAFVEALRVTGYDGVVSAEVLSYGVHFDSADDVASIIHESLEHAFGVGA